MAAIPIYQTGQVLSAGAEEFVAPIVISALQAAFPQFQIGLGSLPAINTHFQFIKGVTIDNSANASGVSFVVTADGTNQSWTVGPGSWQVFKIAGGFVTSLTITPTSWLAGSVTFTLWNTIPPDDVRQFSTFTLAGNINATVTGAVTISGTPNVAITSGNITALGNIDITNAFIKNQLLPVDQPPINISSDMSILTPSPGSLLAGFPPTGKQWIIESMWIGVTQVVSTGASQRALNIYSVSFPSTIASEMISVTYRHAGAYTSAAFTVLYQLNGAAVPVGIDKCITCGVFAGGGPAFTDGFANFGMTYRLG